MKFSYEEKSALGFQYILDAMHPSSPYGQEALHQLRPFRKSQKDALLEELDNIERLLQKKDKISDKVSQLKRLFMQMKDVRPAILRSREMVLSDIELYEIKNFLLYSDKSRKLVGEITRVCDLQGITLMDTIRALDLLDPDQRRIPSFHISSLYSKELARIREEKRRLEKQMEQSRQDQERWQGIKEARNKLVLEEERQEQEVRKQLTDQLQPFLEEILANTRAVAKMDLLLEKAQIASLDESVKPTLSEHQLVLCDASNPWIQNLLKENGLDFTKLSIQLDCGAGVITGANMGGKSVALKTITLNVLLAMCGFYVYGREAVIPFFDDIIIIAQESQSVEKGLSSFGAQIIQLKEMAQQIKEQFCFVVMDEFARGTNPKEGALLVRAVVKYFNNNKVIGLLVTHYDQVAEYARSHYQVVGLRDMDMDKVKMEIAAASPQKGAKVIASHMNYGIYKVENIASCPKDAFRICQLLGLQKEIMDLVEEEG